MELWRGWAFSSRAAPGILEHQIGARLACGCILSQMLQETGASGRIVDITLADILASYVAGNCRFYIHHALSGIEVDAGHQGLAARTRS
jgi:hypothetical protein